MSEHSAKPYLVRAIYEWCSDQGFTPYLAVRVDARTRVPAAHVRNGEIVLNISATATRHLKIDNEWVLFSARFNGVSQEVAVPIEAVAGIFARETGYGFSFAPRSGALQPASPPAETAEKAPAGGAVVPLTANASPADDEPPTDPNGGRPRRRANLQVVK